jgi:2-succinyl-5-enolpyruvyl-6-hydroxy-3-cyclohexene-1-carboxylate synthase
MQLLVANDRGGSIFEALEMAQTLPATSFDRLFRTPQNVNLAKLAEAYGWNHISVDNEPALLAALALEGRNIIEVSL